MMKTSYGSASASSVIASVFVISIVLILIVSRKSGSSITCFGSCSDNSEFRVPIVELRTKVNVSRAVLLSDRSSSATTTTASSSLNRRFKNLSAIREEYRGLELRLARARASIRMAASSRNLSLDVHDGDVLTGRIYRNPGAFYQSYMEMEKRFKVYVYEEGDPPIVHDGPCKDIYTSEGRFIQEMEQAAGRFRTRDAHRAHVYFMPFSVTLMVKYLYKPLSYDVRPLQQFVGDYVRVVSTKYPFWNRTHGADHFMLSCHDWGPHASRGHAQLYNTSIRVLCNANSSEGFNPQKDVTLPEIHLSSGDISPKLLSPPSRPAAPRPHLAFFAGGVHGPIRPALLRHWKDHGDTDMRVYEYLPENLDYYTLMLESKFCLCPSGYEVASPRIVEAIYAECVPVILSENYVLPFSDVLRWEEFSVAVEVSDIRRLKEILMGVGEEKYLRLKEGD
ncbi:hypothetical protein RHGRI_005545 [Rhododendron griersonianum]|uniref:Exostosin GT47 domain-containing protein n=1 Tax=Rhododendron griersonianum TaxID=479676 RepID=A0AAV6LCZ7_9ERIC|nr:hypothetical protein RHGRI_005545 [Rhododendron griersonianum]